MQILKYLLGELLYIISYLTPKSKNIWIFGSWGGDKYADNPKYLFQYINKHQNHVQAVWLTHNKHLVTGMKEEGMIAYHTNSLPGIYFACRASIGVISHGMIDINRYACGRLRIIQTWHGIPMKPILLSDAKVDAIRKRTQLIFLSKLFHFLKKEIFHDNNLLICSSSNHVTSILKKAFGSAAPFVEVGFPRTDGILSPNTEYSISKEIISLKNAGVQVGIFVPTYRKYGESDVIGSLINNSHNIESKMDTLNQILYVRMHPFEASRWPDGYSSEHIRLISDAEIQGDIYSILGLFDFLITDYSSIIFDYLITERPCYFLVPDREEYERNNGEFLYSFQNLQLPEYISWDQLLESYSEDINHDTLNILAERYFNDRDGASSQRIFEYVESTLFHES